MKKTLFAICISLFFLSACGLTDGFKETKSGLKYKFILQNKNAQQPQMGDLMELSMSYSYKDSILFNSFDYGPSVPMQLIEPLYEGDIVEGFAMMGLGDSAIFKVNADSFYYYNVGMEHAPEFISPGAKITFHVGLLGIKTKEVFEREQSEYEKQREAMLQILQKEEEEFLERYLKENNITVEPNPSGLYYIEIKEGVGPRALPGRSVRVHYTGYLVDGKKFDSSYTRDQPISFKIGGGMVIPGFEEGITMMREGGKAKLIVPSKLAYGEQELENIPPFSTLIYEVELIEAQ